MMATDVRAIVGWDGLLWDYLALFMVRLRAGDIHGKSEMTFTPAYLPYLLNAHVYE